MRPPQNDLEQQIEAAFRSREDVSISLGSGEVVRGFLFNRDLAPHPSLRSEPFVEVFLASGERRRYALRELAAVAPSGPVSAAQEGVGAR